MMTFENYKIKYSMYVGKGVVTYVTEDYNLEFSGFPNSPTWVHLKSMLFFLPLFYFTSYLAYCNVSKWFSGFQV